MAPDRPTPRWAGGVRHGPRSSTRPAVRCAISVLSWLLPSSSGGSGTEPTCPVAAPAGVGRHPTDRVGTMICQSPGAGDGYIALNPKSARARPIRRTRCAGPARHLQARVAVDQEQGEPRGGPIEPARHPVAVGADDRCGGQSRCSGRPGEGLGRRRRRLTGRIGDRLQPPPGVTQPAQPPTVTLSGASSPIRCARPQR